MPWLIVTLGTEISSATVKITISKVFSFNILANKEKTQMISCVTYEFYVVLLIQKEVFNLQIPESQKRKSYQCPSSISIR